MLTYTVFGFTAAAAFLFLSLTDPLIIILHQWQTNL